MAKESGKLKVFYRDKKPLYIDIKKDTPLWLSRAEGITPHQNINLTKHPLHFIVIAIK